MSVSSESPNPAPKPPNQSTVILLLGTIADTTWRMFVPTFGGLGLGLWADASWHSEPWCAISGLLLGVIVTSFLIKQQFQEVNK